jgi:hypothetical protein
MSVSGISPSFSGLNGGGGAGGFGGASMALMIGGLLSNTVGSFYSSKAQKYQLKTQAIIADTNARIAEMGAQSALAQGEREIGNLTLKAGQLKSTQRASMAANGVDLGEGNAAEVLASTEIMKEADKNTLQANAIRSAWGYRMQGTNFQNEALTARNTAGAISPWMSAAGTLLGGAGNVASNWYMMNKMGAFDKGSMFYMGGSGSAGSTGAMGGN